jgi:hypothetical protein
MLRLFACLPCCQTKDCHACVNINNQLENIERTVAPATHKNVRPIDLPQEIT